MAGGRPRYGELEPLTGADEHLVRAVRRFLKQRPVTTDFLTIVIPEVVSTGSLLRSCGTARRSC